MKNRLIASFKGSFCIVFLFASCQSNYCSEDSYRPNSESYISRYSNGKPNQFYEIENCYANGLTFHFYENGRIKRYGYSKAGEYIGEWLFYKNDGNLKYRQFYENTGRLNRVTDVSEKIVFYYGSFKIVNSLGDTLKYKNDSIVTRTHPLDFKLYTIASDTIVFETLRMVIKLDARLNEITRYQIQPEE